MFLASTKQESHLVFCPHCQCILVQEMCHTLNIELKKLICLVNLSEMLMDEVICSGFQLWAVKAFC